MLRLLHAVRTWHCLSAGFRAGWLLRRQATSAALPVLPSTQGHMPLVHVPDFSLTHIALIAHLALLPMALIPHMALTHLALMPMALIPHLALTHTLVHGLHQPMGLAATTAPPRWPP